MKACPCLLVLVLCGGPPASRAGELPITFARGGQTVAVPARDGEDESVSLMAFGKRWGQPAVVEHGQVELVVPTVRVPIVFQLTTSKEPSAVQGELVAYPDRQLPWDDNTQLASAGAPEWFDAWSQAVGLPVKRFDELETLEAAHWRDAEKPSLLLLGRDTAGKSPVDVGRLAAEYHTNVLVLAADWFGNLVDKEVVVAPKHATGALADLAVQQWPAPPTFRRHALAWPGILNRQGWLAAGDPLVEEIYSPTPGTEPLRLVLSYAPWQEQLGRCEVADELFLRLLTEAAKGAENRLPLDAQCCLLYPAAEAIKPAERPILAAALPAVTLPPPAKASLFVLDLRGPSSPAEWFERSGEIAAVERRIDKRTPLVILGDNPVLDSWKWLELDRRNQKSPRPGVLWWPEGSLPPSRLSQWRLMQRFTESNVFLGDASQETDHGNWKNER